MRKSGCLWIIFCILNTQVAFAVTNREIRVLLTSVREVLEVPNLFMFKDKISDFFTKEADLIRLTIEMVSKNDHPDDRAWLDAFLRIDAMWVFQNVESKMEFIPKHRFQILHSLIWEWEQVRDQDKPGALYTGPKILHPSFASRLKELLETELKAMALQEQYWNILFFQRERMNERAQIDTRLATAGLAPTCSETLQICEEILSEYHEDLNTLRLARQTSLNLPQEAGYLNRILNLPDDLIVMDEKYLLQTEKFLSALRMAEIAYAENEFYISKGYFDQAFFYTSQNSLLLLDDAEAARRYFALFTNLTLLLQNPFDFIPPGFLELGGDLGSISYEGYPSTETLDAQSYEFHSRESSLGQSESLKADLAGGIIDTEIVDETGIEGGVETSDTLSVTAPQLSATSDTNDGRAAATEADVDADVDTDAESTEKVNSSSTSVKSRPKKKDSRTKNQRRRAKGKIEKKERRLLQEQELTKKLEAKSLASSSEKSVSLEGIPKNLQDFLFEEGYEPIPRKLRDFLSELGLTQINSTP